MLRKALLALAAVVACTTTPASSTALSTTTTTATPPAVEPTKVYYFLDGGDRAGRPGPFLVPVYREVEADDVVARTMVALLAGPTADELGRRLEELGCGDATSDEVLRRGRDQ